MTTVAESSTPTHTEPAKPCDHLRTLPTGWFDGDGTAYDPAGLDWLDAMLDRCPAVATPRIFPMPCGGVQLEWTPGRWSADLEINLATRTGDYHALQLDTLNQVIKDGLNLVTLAGWADLETLLAAIHGA